MIELFSQMTTIELVRVVERIKPPATWLVDTIFPRVEQITSDILPIETLKAHRRLAPYIIDGAAGVNVKRDETQMRLYQAPLTGVKRVIGLNDINRRMIGETPIISTLTPEQRAQELAARDLKELRGYIFNREAQQAAEILQTGAITINGFADDGKTPRKEVIKYAEPSAVTIRKDWTAASADIFKDLKDASERIQENAGIIPTLLICGKNVEETMLKNTAFKEWLLSANANATRFVNYQPQYASPQIRNLGYISALNLEMVSYTETYWNGQAAVPFVDPDSAILCCPGRGRQVFGAVTLLENKQWTTYAAQMIPIYSANETAQTSSISVYSRFILIPETIDDFVCIKTK